MEKPQNVILAVNLLWLSIAIAAISSIVHQDYIGIFAESLEAFFAFKISSARNWARIAFSLITVSTLPFIFLHLLSDLPHRNAIAGAIGIFQFALQVIVVFLLFTKPANVWFRADIKSAVNSVVFKGKGKENPRWLTILIPVSRLLALLFILGLLYYFNTYMVSAASK
jgi:hypothetical protein